MTCQRLLLEVTNTKEGQNRDRGREAEKDNAYTHREREKHTHTERERKVDQPSGVVVRSALYNEKSSRGIGVNI